MALDNGEMSDPQVESSEVSLEESRNVSGKVSPYSISALRAELNQKGQRMTPQREAILQVFVTLPTGEHLSAEEIHHVLKEAHPAISLSTVYRTVKVMAQMGVLRELELAEGHKHYEINLKESHHHHLTCVRCTKTIEFKSSSALKVGAAAAQKEGFLLLDCQLVVHALCPSCSRSLV
jgi:Fur family transcriptional regulator, ferric uptake regulator